MASASVRSLLTKHTSGKAACNLLQTTEAWFPRLSGFASHSSHSSRAVPGLLSKAHYEKSFFKSAQIKRGALSLHTLGQVRCSSSHAANHLHPDATPVGSGTTKIPSFADYQKQKQPGSEAASRAFSYFMVGTTGVLTAAGAKATVHDFLSSMSASADVLALAKVEVDLTAIPEGKNVVVKWRGKPIFIRHRTASEIEEANTVNISELRHPETDAARTKDLPQWLVMLGICTHLGCVPIGEAGDFGGWFCPCHGSHYDISGRIRKGPAPLNLEIPPYEILGEKLVVG